MARTRLLLLFISFCVLNTYAQKGDSATHLPAAKDIISKYINAIGGAEELKKINSILMEGEMSMSGMKLNMTKKDLNPNYSLTVITMNGQEVVKQLFDGKTGYRVQMGNQQPLSDDELADRKNAKGIFQQLYYSDSSYKLLVLGLGKVNGNDAYQLQITTPAGNKSIEYYDMNSGLLVRAEKITKMGGQDIKQTVEYNNYKKVGNILFAFSDKIIVSSPMGDQDRQLEIHDIKLNEGVKLEDFK
jgi:zinc protease